MKNPLYFIEVDYGKKIGRSFRELDRDQTSQAQVVADIISGEVENVLCVLEVFEDEKSCRNITEDIAREVADQLHSRGDGCPEHLRDWIDQWLGVSTADYLDAPCGRSDFQEHSTLNRAQQGV